MNPQPASRFTRRAGELIVGHAVNSVLSWWAFDYVLYPFAIWKLGLVTGGLVMSFASLVLCLLMLWFYDWSKRDWLGIEAVKELRDGAAKTRWRRLLAWALAKGDLPACVALSLYTDPFITTACLRRGAFNGMTRRDWRIFFASWLIANGSWALACFGGVEAVTRLWRGGFRADDGRRNLPHRSGQTDPLDTPRGVCIHCVCVRIVKEKFLRDAVGQYPKGAKYLAAWVKLVRAADWRGLADVRRSYPSADMVRVGSGKPVLVFNVCGNSYRMVVAMHFDRQTAYTLRFLTHAEYSAEHWKDEL